MRAFLPDLVFIRFVSGAVIAKLVEQPVAALGFELLDEFACCEAFLLVGARGRQDHDTVSHNFTFELCRGNDEFSALVRYLKATLICGFVVSLIVAGVYEAGLLRNVDLGLWNFLGGNSNPPLGRSIVGYVAFVLLAFAIAWTTIDISKLSLKWVIAAAALAEVVAATWVLNLFHVFFSPFAPGLAVLLSFCFGLVYARSEAGQRKRTLRLIFGDRISREAFYALVDAKQPPRFEGEMREVSIVVCEVFNHDDLMDALPTEDYVAITNLFLRRGGDYLVEKGGYLDECDGESLRVIFGAPLADANHAV